MEGELHVNLVCEISWRNWLRHHGLLRDINGFALACTAALLVTSFSGGGGLLTRARLRLQRLCIGNLGRLEISLTLLHDPLRLVGSFLCAVVLVVLLVLELLNELLKHALDLFPGEVEEDGRQDLQLVQVAAELVQCGCLQVGASLSELRHVSQDFSAILRGGNFVDNGPGRRRELLRASPFEHNLPLQPKLHRREALGGDDVLL
mmetsp:Transcript_59948/g.97038  ORF Transcript_59948/g.97038 Transcript_59948/m.97038 type:complete len:205 (+) Transcript_59948:1618-2232(+)